MPITFTVAAHGAERVNRSAKDDYSAQDLLPYGHNNFKNKRCKELLRSSFGSKNAPIPPDQSFARTGENGLVHTVVRAYNQHHALVLRPDDIWLAIIVQFSCFINAPWNSQRLCCRFVAHEGKKELVVRAVGDRYSADFGALAQQMTGLLAQNVVDPELRSWILPGFTTTTDNDRVVGSVLMMATLKNYFSFGFKLACGIPRVTLQGERADWEDIARRVEKIEQYGDEAVLWYRMLKPVLRRIVATFDDPGLQDEALRGFWGRMIHWQDNFSGPSTISGWMTAFCAFSFEGQWQGTAWSGEEDMLVLDGVQYPTISAKCIPAAYAEVDVKLNDNGLLLDTVMVAGLKDARLSSSGDSALSSDGVDDTLAPMVAWWMYEKQEPRARPDSEFEL